MKTLKRIWNAIRLLFIPMEHIKTMDRSVRMSKLWHKTYHVGLYERCKRDICVQSQEIEKFLNDNFNTQVRP